MLLAHGAHADLPEVLTAVNGCQDERMCTLVTDHRAVHHAAGSRFSATVPRASLDIDRVCLLSRAIVGRPKATAWFTTLDTKSTEFEAVNARCKVSLHGCDLLRSARPGACL